MHSLMLINHSRSQKNKNGTIVNIFHEMRTRIIDKMVKTNQLMQNKLQIIANIQNEPVNTYRTVYRN